MKRFTCFIKQKRHLKIKKKGGSWAGVHPYVACTARGAGTLNLKFLPSSTVAHPPSHGYRRRKRLGTIQC